MPDREHLALVRSICDRWTDAPMKADEFEFPRLEDYLGPGIEGFERIGIWPEASSVDKSQPGAPFISEVGDYRSLHFDWNCVQSGMSVRDPLKLTLDYTKVMMSFLFFDRYPNKIEMIGLGGGSLAKYCHHVLPDSNITVVEIKNEIIDLRDHFCVPPDDHRFDVLCEDGAEYVRRSLSESNVILIDGFDEYGQSPQLCTSEFYDLCYARLARNGLMIVNLWGGDGNNVEYLARMHRSFQGNMIVVPSEGGSNLTVIARKGAGISLPKAQLEGTCASLRQRHATFLPAIGRRIWKEIERPTRRAVQDGAAERRSETSFLPAVAQTRD